MKRSVSYLIIFFLMVAFSGYGQQDHLSSGMRNPLVPGYFADPTIQKYGDTWYLYTTTDGIKLASGEPQIWISKDFVNWFNYEMDMRIPEGLTNVWAPDVFRGSDGRYYYYMGNCQRGCNIYGYASESPMGPWLPVKNGEAVIEVGTGIEHLPALDAQFLVDDDGSVYSYFGTWSTSFGGMGWAKIDPNDNYTILDEGSIPLSQIPHAFEAAYPIKRNGKYFLMYSAGNCHLSSYAVHYAVSDSPTGPFSYRDNSPVLETNEDGTIDGPGHHSVLKTEEGEYYMLYHRHDNPHSSGGMFRQVSADPMHFADDSTIMKVEPSHRGVGFLGPDMVSAEDLALGATTSATSYYHLVSEETRFSNADINYKYKPDFAVDDNNGTMWKASSSRLPQSLVVDLGKKKKFKRVMTQFEYPTFYYQYKIEYSADSLNWTVFADKTNNRRSGSPLIDDGKAKKARYIRITVTGTEKAGLFPAIWNIKVYNALFEVPPYENPEMAEGPGEQGTGELLVDLDVSSLDEGPVNDPISNRGSLTGEFEINGSLEVKRHDGIKSLYFDGSSFLRLNKRAPATLDWNSPYTVSVWVNNPEVDEGECLVNWNSRRNMLMGSYSALMYGSGPYGAVAHGDGYVDLSYEDVPEAGAWHHIVLTFDGMKEEIYVDGVLVKEFPISLFVENGPILIGASGQRNENFSGYIANARLYEKPLTPEEVLELMKQTNPRK